MLQVGATEIEEEEDDDDNDDNTVLSQTEPNLTEKVSKFKLQL
jgi:hypothetical protein